LRIVDERTQLWMFFEQRPQRRHVIVAKSAVRKNKWIPGSHID
jgi:hypothetical protein